MKRLVFVTCVCVAGACREASIIDHGALIRDLSALASDRMEGREVGTAGSAMARAYLTRRLAEIRREAVKVDTQEFHAVVRGERRRGVNVLFEVPGRARSGHSIVVSAHYDHLGRRRGRTYNGANDNASGTAALLAIAGYLSAHPPTHTVILAAFDGEEHGLLGSRAYVAAMPHHSLPAVNLNLDMLARESGNVLHVVGANSNPCLPGIVQHATRDAPLSIRIGHDGSTTTEDDWSNDSDQYAFLEAGVPALLLGVGDARHHHRPSDEARSINARFYVRAVEAAVAILSMLDEHLDAIHLSRGQDACAVDPGTHRDSGSAIVRINSR